MNKTSWHGSIIDKNVTARFKKLGDLGENIAESLLLRAGFEQIINLNKERQNTKSFDLTAKRGGQSFAISVKARNKFENSVAGVKLNSRYKLTDNPELFESEAQEIYNSIPAWIAIPIDIKAGTFDAYFGELKDLKGNKKGIIISSQAISHYETLAQREAVESIGIQKEDLVLLQNKYERK